MNKPTIIRALTLDASMGAVLALTVPASASKDHAIGRITTPVNSHHFGVPACS